MTTTGSSWSPSGSKEAGYRPIEGGKVKLTIRSLSATIRFSKGTYIQNCIFLHLGPIVLLDLIHWLSDHIADVQGIERGVFRKRKSEYFFSQTYAWHFCELPSFEPAYHRDRA